MITYYIPTPDSKTLNQAQELLFALGYKWSFGLTKLTKSYQSPIEGLCVDSYNFDITYVTRVSYCEEMGHIPVTIKDLTKKLLLGENFYDKQA